ncbi:MAG: glycosyltransferase family 2 protein [Solirubrobacteraceae bacterium]
MSPVTAPDLSVIVCTHNGAGELSTVLAGLQGQELDGPHLELIVVDDGSTDGTAAVAARAGARVVTLRENQGIAGARNAGVAAARAPIVAFTDDDCEPHPEWASTLAARFADESVGGVGGRVIPTGPPSYAIRYLSARNPLTPLPAELADSPSLSKRLRIYLRGVTGRSHDPAAGARLYSAVGANMAFRRSVLVGLGGFDEAFRFGGEEEELCRRMHTDAGRWQLVYEPGAVVKHHFKASTWDTLRRARAYGRGNAREALKYGERHVIVFPLPVLVALGLLAALARRRPRWAVAAGALPLVGYPRWISDARRDRSLEAVTFPYLELAQEVYTMLGEADGYRAGYEPVRARNLTPS